MSGLTTDMGPTAKSAKMENHGEANHQERQEVRPRRQFQLGVLFRFCLGVLGGCLVVALGFALAVPPDSAAADSITPDPAKPEFRIVESGPVRISAKLLPRRAGKPLTVGDRFKLELSVSRHRNQQVSEPFPDTLGSFLVIDRSTTTKYKGDTIVDTHRLEMAAFAPGELALPRFVVAWPAEGTMLAVRSESLGLVVKSVLPEKMQDINDLKPQVQFPFLLPIWLTLGLLVLLTLAWLGWRFFRRWRTMRLMARPLPPPWDEALASLAAVPVQDWLDAGQVKRYYYSVSEILKRYLTRRFKFPALDQTTSEIVLAMKREKVELREEFGDFFRRADLVKYAKLVPPRPEMDAVVSRAEDMVKRTTPAPEPESKHQDTKITKVEDERNRP
jgi:hypothetical protein